MHIYISIYIYIYIYMGSIPPEEQEKSDPGSLVCALSDRLDPARRKGSPILESDIHVRPRARSPPTWSTANLRTTILDSEGLTQIES